MAILNTCTSETGWGTRQGLGGGFSTGVGWIRSMPRVRRVLRRAA